MRVFRLTVIVGILTLFVQCASVPLTGRKQVILLPESEMMQMSLTSYGDFLKENKLSLGNIKYEYSDTYNNGIVISQDPKSGSENNQEWGTVNVVVSKGHKEEVIQPPHTQDNTTSGNTGGDTSGSTGQDKSGINYENKIK